MAFTRFAAPALRAAIPSILSSHQVSLPFICNGARPLAAGSQTATRNQHAFFSSQPALRCDDEHQPEKIDPGKMSNGWHSDAVGPSSDKTPSPSQVPAVEPDTLAQGDALGKTGGGKPLDSSSKNAPPQPKILNASIPGGKGAVKLTEEQQREVDEHNREFEKGFDHAATAEPDKVDEKFWNGGGDGKGGKAK